MMNFINAKNSINTINVRNAEMNRIKNQLLAVLPTTNLNDFDGSMLIQLVIDSKDAEIRDAILNNPTLELNDNDISNISIYVDDLMDDDTDEHFAPETVEQIAIKFPQLFPHLSNS